MNNVYYVGSGELTFDLIERIINENLKTGAGSGSQAADTEVPRLSGQEDCGVGRTLVWHYHRFRLVVQ